VLVFDTEASQFEMKGDVVMRGWRCPETKLWRIPLKPQWSNNNTETALLSQKATDIMVERRKEWNFDLVNSVYELPNTEQVVAWYHASAGYPTKATWLKAIEAGFYATWPMLTAKAVRKHFPEHDETQKGHMKRVKSGVRSTKAQVQEPPEIEEAMIKLAELRRKHRDIYVQIKDVNEMIYSDQTGRFPITSSKGHKYIMVLIEIDGNYISMEPMRSRDTDEIIRAYSTIIERLRKKHIIPRKQMLDNEAPQEFLKVIEDYNIEWELVPPYNHR
jgi:hypothetical protein